MIAICLQYDNRWRLRIMDENDSALGHDLNVRLFDSFSSRVQLVGDFSFEHGSCITWFVECINRNFCNRKKWLHWHATLVGRALVMLLLRWIAADILQYERRIWYNTHILRMILLLFKSNKKLKFWPNKTLNNRKDFCNKI